ncbi:MAG: transporter [Hyphomicrobiales bacterium]|nr:transporter [Hyphomicrobiales bacterium]
MIASRFLPAGAGGRNAAVLALCQGLYVCGFSVDLTLTGINGYQLAPDKVLATLPFALIAVGAAIVTVLAAFIIGRLGRRVGFAIGSLCGASGGLVSVWAVFHGQFWVFCIGTALIGGYQGFAQYYSIAAADSVSTAQKSRAISTVLAGGVLAALAGPVLANWSKDLIPGVMFAGAYVLVAGLALLSTMLLLSLYRDIEPHLATGTDPLLPPRPLREIVRQPIFGAGVATTMAAAAGMVFMMTAAPLAAVACNYSIGDGAQIIQWHLIGMFVPSFFSGRLVARFGVWPILALGMGLIAASAAIAIASTALIAFYMALFVLGVGWNFMIVCGTTLLSQSYRPNERAKTQALSGVLGNTAGTIAALSSGAILVSAGWTLLNFGVLPILALCLLMILRWVQADKTPGPVAVS